MDTNSDSLEKKSWTSWSSMKDIHDVIVTSVKKSTKKISPTIFISIKTDNGFSLKSIPYKKKNKKKILNDIYKTKATTATLISQTWFPSVNYGEQMSLNFDHHIEHKRINALTIHTVGLDRVSKTSVFKMGKIKKEIINQQLHFGDWLDEAYKLTPLSN
tara:strand:- start:138 stop:614 length:477 start_codon:yes stop_codon:yes gene_type:complete